MQRTEIEWMPIGSVKPYDRNPRRNDDAVDAVANSISEFGFKNPIIVDSDLVIIAGHTRLKAAKKLGLKEVPVVIASDLTAEQARAFRLVDNRTAELADWDLDMLVEEIDATDFDFSDFGFSFVSDDKAVDFSDLESMMGAKDEAQQEFEDKFKIKHTTDDCFTPPVVYEAVKGWVLEHYGISEDREIVRPFYPGGDYKMFEYPEGCLVLDNPPFSIMSEIVEFYKDKGIDWHLEDGCAYHCISGELHGVAVTSSANVNTNPRIEQAVITVDREVADFYRGFFDSLKPKNPWPVPWEPWEAERCPR